MIEVNIDFFKKLYKSDIVFHYTKASTAIDHIFYKNQLRFSKARNSIDPIESKKAHRGTIYFGDIESTPNNNHYADVDELHDFVNNIEENFNLICFCQNKMGEDFANKNYISNFDGNQELFGFTKLRMWDQYADNFAGVCIAFSKRKLLSLNKSNLELIDGDVEYLTFQDLNIKKLGNIQGNHLLNVGKETYKKQLESIIKQSFFFKHVDYSGETEYRIGTFYDKSKCTFEVIQDDLVRENMMLNISGCVEAIFVSSYANKKQKDDLLRYANKLKVKIIEMKWNYNSFTALDYRESSKLLESIMKRNK